MDTEPDPNNATVDFGFQKVAPAEKTERVGEVFSTVARRYDLMNDLMSFGTHRIMKRMVIHMSGVRAGHRVLDLAGGTGDMAALFGPVVGHDGAVIMTDLNAEMLAVGRDRLLDKGMTQIQYCRAPAESLPFTDDAFDVACISFGIRNFTDKDTALRELHRVIRPGGTLIVLEFSQPKSPLLGSAYKAFQALWPTAGGALVGAAQPYEYLVESIRVHPSQEALQQMFEDAGFRDVYFENLVGGIAAIHRGSVL